MPSQQLVELQQQVSDLDSTLRDMQKDLEDVRANQPTPNFALNQGQMTAGYIQERHLVADTSYAVGDMFYGDGTRLVRLAPGTDGQVLSLSSGAPSWITQVQPASDGWIAAGETWTYASVDAPTGVITVPTDATTKYSTGMRVKFTQTTVKYGIITAISATSMTIYTGTDYTLTNAAITLPYYSMVKAPFGFPMNPAKWTQTVTNNTLTSQNSPTINVWYNTGSVNISIPIGLWTVNYSTQVYNNGSGAMSPFSTLSTANNSESNVRMTRRGYATSVAGLSQSLTASGLYSLSSKTTHYLNIKTDSSGTTAITINPGTETTYIDAICAYL